MTCQWTGVFTYICSNIKYTINLSSKMCCLSFTWWAQESNYPCKFTVATELMLEQGMANLRTVQVTKSKTMLTLRPWLLKITRMHCLGCLKKRFMCS